MTEEVKKLFIPRITKAIRKGKCIFFLGSYASIGDNGKYPPSAKRLTELLSDDLTINGEQSTNDAEKIKNGGSRDNGEEQSKKSKKPQDNGETTAKHVEQNLAKVALLYEMTFTRGDLFEKLENLVGNDDFEPTTIQRFVAKVAKKGFDEENGINRIPMIVTTNYDQLMEKALDEEGITPKVYAQILKDKVKHWQFNVPGDQLVLYKFHGCITKSGSIVITEEDYINVLKNQLSESSKYPKQFEPVFIQNEMLFLGYSLEDWTFRLFYTTMLAHADLSEKKPSYAIQKNPLPAMVKHWDAEKNIKILNCDQFDFIEALAKELEIDL